jgi:hypothetical protein
MKKNLTVLGLAVATFFSVTACSANNNGMNLNNHNRDTMNMSTRTEPGNAQNPTTQSDIDNGNFGFVRVKKGPDGRVMGGDQIPSLDFEQMANMISRLAVRLPNVHDVSTLATSHEVLVGYRTDSKNRKQTADQVKRTAISVVPRFYHVYVTDDPRVTARIASLQGQAPTTDNEQMLDAIIKEMKQASPQGRNVNKSENPNGEQKNNPLDQKHR